MMSQTSSPNRANKSPKQRSTPVTAEGRRTYRKSQLSRAFQTTKGVETSKACSHVKAHKLKRANNHNQHYLKLLHLIVFYTQATQV